MNDTDQAENTTEIDGVVECLIGFVAETTIQSIKRATDDSIANWYYAASPRLDLSQRVYTNSGSYSTPRSSSRTAITFGIHHDNASSAESSATSSSLHRIRSTQCWMCTLKKCKIYFWRRRASTKRRLICLVVLMIKCQPLLRYAAPHCSAELLRLIRGKKACQMR